jgi:hypothetical protein
MAKSSVNSAISSSVDASVPRGSISGPAGMKALAHDTKPMPMPARHRANSPPCHCAERSPK